MLQFWYSERCTREIKLVISISVCVLVFLCAEQKQLDPIFIGLSIAIGVLTHVLYEWKSKTTLALNPILRGILDFLPFICLIVLMYFLPDQQRLFLALQCVGFAALGLFIVSIYSQRSKRFDH